MTRINTNVNSLIAQRILGQNNQDLSKSLERLSTGLRINRGADDPSGLIASQNLRAEKSALTAAISNAERADQVVNIAEGGLNEVSDLLTQLQGLVTATANDAGLSQEEKEANQLQIDSILQTIDRVAGATSFQGTKLLNGTFDYDVETVDAAVNSYRVNGAKLGFGETLDVEVAVTGSAAVGGFLLEFGGANLDLTSAGATFVIEVAGSLGSRELSFASGTGVSTIISTINSFSDVTGVEATISGTDDLRLTSVERGADEFVSVKVIDDGGAAGNGVTKLDDGDEATASGSATAWNALTNGLTDSGKDVEVFINGQQATTKGTVARVNTDFLDVQIDLAYDTGNPSAGQVGAFTAFTITGGGADFQLGGRVDIAGKVSLGVQNVAVREIGKVTDNSTDYSLADIGAGKSLNVVDGDLTVAQKAVEEAIKNVSSIRGRLGAFQSNTIGATIRSLGVSLENTAAAESVIRDVDFASETAALTRGQILAASAGQVLTLANSQPQSALQLLG
ncbi:MAG: flagellin [Phycisphaerales bacterium]|nr:flagellin [Phycisphaerales bacterium]